MICRPVCTLVCNVCAMTQGIVLQLVTIITMCIAWVGMTAGLFGQNLYFNVAATPLVSDREHSLFHFPVN